MLNRHLSYLIKSNRVFTLRKCLLLVNPFFSKLQKRISHFEYMHALRIFILLFFSFPICGFSQTILSITVKGGINPSSAEFIQDAIDQAEKEKAECLLIHLNTPGGLVTSTRDIVSGILRSKVPVIVYVNPEGAHAGSAGVFITLAANIAAMAPGTNIGAAHPVSLQGKLDSTMNEKLVNDAAAFIKTIAEKRNRNVEWAQQAVRKSVSITEREALEKNVIDVIALNDAILFKLIDGKEVESASGKKTLHTKNAKVKEVKMGFFQKILNGISDPNVAYILLMLGFYGIVFELMNPGAILPGIAGVIFLVFAFYAMNTMPVNYAGIGLIVFAIILFLLEIKIVSHGMLAIGGIISLLLGSFILFRQSPEENIIQLSTVLVITTTVVTALFFIFVAGMGLKAQRSKPVTGLEAIVGKKGYVLEPLEPAGIVSVNGEIWKAETAGEKIGKNENVIVKGIKNLTLTVEQAVIV
ncbi:nodulation protein NfeD [soil metagenome]